LPRHHHKHKTYPKQRPLFIPLLSLLNPVGKAKPSQETREDRLNTIRDQERERERERETRNKRRRINVIEDQEK